MTTAQRKRLEALEQKAGEYIPRSEVKNFVCDVYRIVMEYTDDETACRIGDRFLELMPRLGFYDPLEPAQRQP